ncbi:hypothetical protein ANN_09595 [Periplaneta americana]|uniref:cytidine deaminase n=1 Tax=Periplaneta americana TaxID=6978 RepID=A0ABQ8TP03_PERAM|nr:hypothetical protein ANN_09595 [Periplaneta americana]
MESKIVDFSTLAIQDLVRRGVSAREFAYCPYSKFQVGAALLCNDGTVFTGCNVENSAYGASICAERTAVVKAVSSGHKNYRAIAVVASHGDTFVSPCGTCRQFISEFSSEAVVYLVKPDLSKVLQTSVKELLPLNSSIQDLIRKSVSVRELAYCPYSKFQVGAALQCSDGTVFTGCNVENASYGDVICAEQTAIVKAVSSGNRNYKTIVVAAALGDTFVSPSVTLWHLSSGYFRVWF